MVKIDEVLKNSSLINEDLTFNEETTYLEFLLQNAKTEEEQQDIKETINNFLEITDDKKNSDE